jgi:hypothetical protein
MHNSSRPCTLILTKFWPPHLNPGDWVLLKRKKNQENKLGLSYNGPFKVVEIRGPNAVKLDFPKDR